MDDDLRQALLARLQDELPAVFAGTKLDELTGSAIAWGTIQNKRTKSEIPEDCFLRSGRIVLIVRDPFLTWWISTLGPGGPAVKHTPKSVATRGPRKRAAMGPPETNTAGP